MIPMNGLLPAAKNNPGAGLEGVKKVVPGEGSADDFLTNLEEHLDPAQASGFSAKDAAQALMDSGGRAKAGKKAIQDPKAELLQMAQGGTQPIPVKPTEQALEGVPIQKLILKDQAQKAPSEMIPAKAMMRSLDGVSSPGPIPMELRGTMDPALLESGKDSDSVESISREWSSAEVSAQDLENGSALEGAPLIRDQDGRVQELFNKPGVKLESIRTMDSKISSDPAQVKGLPSRVSTEDFLSLREIKREKGPRNAIGDARIEPPVLMAHPIGKGMQAPAMELPVTQGTAGKTVLSHDAIHQLSQQVNLLSQAKQDGEIKIRLKPDHLGDLMMSVKTSGQNVAIQIKAHAPEAKRILEESIGRLKDSLSTQNLNLSSVDIVAQPQSSQSTDPGMRMDLGQNQGGWGQETSQQQGREGNGTRQDFLLDEPKVSSSLGSVMGRRGSRASSAGGLDLIA